MKRVTDRNNPLFDEDDYLRSCKGKKTYTTPYHALFAIEETESREPGLKLSYYKCPYCGNYHLTGVKKT